MIVKCDLSHIVHAQNALAISTAKHRFTLADSNEAVTTQVLVKPDLARLPIDAAHERTCAIV